MNVTFCEVTKSTAGVAVGNVEVGYVWLADGKFKPYLPLRAALADNTVELGFMKEIDDAIALFMVTERLTS